MPGANIQTGRVEAKEERGRNPFNLYLTAHGLHWQTKLKTLMMRQKMGGDGVIETSKVVFAAITKQKNEDGNNQRIECDESPVSYHALCIPNNGSTVQRLNGFYLPHMYNIT